MTSHYQGLLLGFQSGPMKNTLPCSISIYWWLWQGERESKHSSAGNKWWLYQILCKFIKWMLMYFSKITSHSIQHFSGKSVWIGSGRPANQQTVTTIPWATLPAWLKIKCTICSSTHVVHILKTSLRSGLSKNALFKNSYWNTTLQLLFCIPLCTDLKISLTLRTKLRPLILWYIFWGMLFYNTCVSSWFCVVTVSGLGALALAILCNTQSHLAF